MIKNGLIPSIVLVVLALLAIWVVRDEGEKSRRAVQDLAREQSADIKEDVREGIKSGVGDLIDEAKSAPGQVLDEFGNLLGSERSEKPPTPAVLPARALEILDKILPQRNDKTPTNDRPAGEDGAASSRRRQTTPEDLIARSFQLGREVFKTADDIGQSVLAISTKEEIELGKHVREALARHCRFADRPDELDRIRRLAAPVLMQRARKEIEYAFAIVDHAEMNAFSILGGSIYIHSGLLDRTPTDAELQGILAHEIGHVDLKHCAAKFTYAVRAGEIGGDAASALTQAAHRLLSLAYSADQEFEADEFAFQKLIEVGQSRENSLAFTRFVLKADAAAGRTSDRAKPKSGLESIGHEVSRHYRTHPDALERVQRLERMNVDP